MKEEIGKRIQKLREDMNITKEAFAKEIGISGQYLGLVEHGKNYLSIEKLKSLCDFTHASADYILFGKDPDIVTDTKNMLSQFTNEQITAACEVLRSLALFMNSN